MALPRHIPAGDGSDSDSPPQIKRPRPTSIRAKAEEESPLPVIEEELPELANEEDQRRAEYEEFLRWRDSKGKDPQPPASVPRHRSTPPQSKPVQPVAEDSFEEQPADESNRWAIDKKTGKSYKKFIEIPKEEIEYFNKSKGSMTRQMRELIDSEVDFDIDDLNGTATTFMAHLRVPPSPEEREEILRKKAEIAKRQQRDREELNQQIDSKDGVLEEPEVDPFQEKSAPKRGLFGRKK